METKQKINGRMNAVLWVFQFLLAAGLIWAVCMKWFKSTDELAAMWPWAADNPGLVKLTGVFDLLAGLGILIPARTVFLCRLNVAAALGIVLLMIAASAFHIWRNEASLIGINVAFALFAGFVVWGRTRL